MIFFIRIKVYRYLTLICHLMKMFYSAGAASPSQSVSIFLFLPPFLSSIREGCKRRSFGCNTPWNPQCRDIRCSPGALGEDNLRLVHGHTTSKDSSLHASLRIKPTSVSQGSMTWWRDGAGSRHVAITWVVPMRNCHWSRSSSWSTCMPPPYMRS